MTNKNHMDYVNKWIKDIENQIKVCNGSSLAGYTFNVGTALRNAYFTNEIDSIEEKVYANKINDLRKSFDKNCNCRHN